MARVICTLDNASTSINGIAFAGEPGHMVSEEIPEDIAATLATIPGFHLAEPSGQTSSPGTDGEGQSGGAGGEGGSDTSTQATPATGEGKRKKNPEPPPAS